MMMKATPDKSFYAFCLNPDRAGYFNLMFKSNTHAPVTTWVSTMCDVVNSISLLVARQSYSGSVRFLW